MNELKFSYLAGVVDANDKTRFERQLFRTTRGNCYIRFADIEHPISDPVTGVPVSKMVFIVFYKVSRLGGKGEAFVSVYFSRCSTVLSGLGGDCIVVVLNGPKSTRI